MNQINTKNHAPTSLEVKVIDAYVNEHSELALLGQRAKEDSLLGKVNRMKFKHKTTAYERPEDVSHAEYCAYMRT